MLLPSPRPPAAIAWSAYPAALGAGCFALGILGATAWPGPGVGAWGLGLAAAGALAGLAVWHGRRRLVSLAPLGLALAAALGAVAAGGLRTAAFRTLPPDHLAHLWHAADTLTDAGAARFDAVPVTLGGVVADAPDRGRRAVRFTLDARRLTPAGTTDTVAVTGRVRVRFAPSRHGPPRAAFPRVTQGDRLRLVGDLRPPPAPRNPSDFDYGAYLRRRGLYATLTLYDGADVAVTGSAAGPVTWVVRRARAYVEAHLARHVPDADARAVLRALLLGDRSQVTDATRAAFADTGLMHLLAVSGLHVVLVGFVLYGLLRPLLVRLGLGWRPAEVTRAALTVVVLGFYALLTGGSASVVRAVVMAALLIGGHVLQRSAHALNTLGVAALVLLAARPTMLLDAGFQLSFAAVAAIVTLNPVLHHVVPARWTAHAAGAWVVQMTTVSLAATLGTAPVLLAHFGQVAFAGLALNLVAIPATGLALAGALLTTLAGGLSTAVAGVLGAATTACVQVLLATATLGAETLGALTWRGAVADPWRLAAMTAALVALAQLRRPRLRWRLAGAALACVAVSLGLALARGDHRPRLDVLFFDVGQGDAALLTMPNGRTLLIDAGKRTPTSDAAVRTILPHLRRHGVDRLDAVVVTHADSDHLGGVPSLLRAVEVGAVWHNGWPADTELYAETMHLLDSLRIPHRAARAGDTLALDPSVAIQVLAPPPAPAAHGFGENDASVVLRAVYGRTRWLFAGDVEAAAERWLTTHAADVLASDVVKVAHHGSSTSSTPALVEAATRRAADGAARAAPVHAVVSVGARNGYGLPSAEVLGRWRDAGARLHRTATAGAVHLRSDGTGVEHVQWRK